AQDEREAVGFGTNRILRADDAAGSVVVMHHHRSFDDLAERFGDHAGNEVGSIALRKGHDDANGVGCRGGSRKCQNERACDRAQKVVCLHGSWVMSWGKTASGRTRYGIAGSDCRDAAARSPALKQKAAPLRYEG